MSGSHCMLSDPLLTYMYIWHFLICCLVRNAPFSIREQCLIFHTADMSAGSNSKDICSLTQQTGLLCDTADMSAESRCSHVRCVKQQVCCETEQTCLVCHTADMPAVSCSRHACCVTQQTCPAVSNRTHACCVTQQTCAKQGR